MSTFIKVDIFFYSYHENSREEREGARRKKEKRGQADFFISLPCKW
jgi:hypothetical protein